MLIIKPMLSAYLVQLVIWPDSSRASTLGDRLAAAVAAETVGWPAA